MIGRVLRENGEIVGVIYSAKLIFPDVRVVKVVIAKHIQHWNHADNGTEQVRPLRQCSTYEQTRVGTAKYGQFSRSGSSCFD